MTSSANMMIKLHRNEEKTCVLKQAQFTCEAKMVCDLTPCERSLTLGLEQAHDEDYAVRVKWDDNGMVGRFDYGTEKDMVVVRRGYIDHPFRDFVVISNEMHLLVLHVEGSPRLAIDMLRAKSKLDNRITMFIKDWKHMQSFPSYDLKKAGVTAITDRWKPGQSVQDWQIRLWSPEKGRAIYGLITPWTKSKKLVIPLGRYNHPATEDEMWTDRYLYRKDDSMFRAVYLFWNTRIVDKRTIEKSWFAYAIPASERDLIKKMICWIFLDHYPNSRTSVEGMPINASPRTGAPIQKWDEQAILNSSLMSIMQNHITEARADMDLVSPGTDAMDMYKDPIISAKKRIIDLYGDDTPNLFHEED